MVDAIPELKPECTKTAVTDAGTNMLSAMKISRHMDSNLKCVDHIMNTAIQTAWKAENETPVANILKMCTDLSAYVHRSSLAAGHIKQVYLH
jgi:prophage DNA circulation protein